MKTAVSLMIDALPLLHRTVASWGHTLGSQAEAEAWIHNFFTMSDSGWHLYVDSQPTKSNGRSVEDGPR
jgi:hypothetical protein